MVINEIKDKEQPICYLPYVKDYITSIQW
jgi:ribosomal 30S subunit maturation factor RimM